jgi:hypothetical protein
MPKQDWLIVAKRDANGNWWFLSEGAIQSLTIDDEDWEQASDKTRQIMEDCYKSFGN